MRRRNAEAPIIIKRGRRAEESAHGGNWKVALADFMTSMFIFCLAMWLLNIKTVEQKLGISDYFAPVSVSPNTNGSSGVLGGQSIIVDGALPNASGPPTIFPVSTPELLALTDPELIARLEELGYEPDMIAALMAAKGDLGFDAAAGEAAQTIADVPELQELLAQGLLEVKTVEQGLRITLKEAEGQPMFNLGSAQPLERTRNALREIAQVLQTFPNPVRVVGHTDGRPYASGLGGYSNWELSADRANATRRVLLQSGLAPQRFFEVVGKADTELLNTDPLAAENRRLDIIVMRGGGAPGSLPPGIAGAPTAGANSAVPPNPLGSASPAGTGVPGAVPQSRDPVLAPPVRLLN